MRFRSHLQGKTLATLCFNALDFWWVEESVAARRTYCEDLMIRALSPPLNRQHASKTILATLGEPVSAQQ